MNAFQNICITLGATTLVLALVPQTNIVQAEEDTSSDQQERVLPSQERISEQHSRAQELWVRADVLRQRAFRSIEAARDSQHFIMQTSQNSDNLRPTKQKLETEIQKFEQAKETLQQNPSKIENQKTILAQAIQSLLQHAELSKQRVEQFPIIQEDLKASILTEIDAETAKLTELSLKTQAAESAEDIQSLAQELREYRKQVNEERSRKLMLLANIGVFENRFLQTIANRADRIQAGINALSAKDSDTSELQHLLNEATATIDDVSANLTHIKSDVQKNEITEEVFNNAKESLEGVNDDIKNVYQDFRQIAQKAASL